MDKLAKLSNLDGSNIIYIDEAGIDKEPFREYARGKKGQRVYGKVSGQRHSRTNIIAAYSKVFKRLFSPQTTQGFTNTQTVYDWLNDLLLPELKLLSEQTGIKDFVLVFDNASFHKARRIQDLVESYGFTLLFLSAYSPDFNPIEHQWEALKANLARLRTTTETFWNDLKQQLARMSQVQV